MRLGWGRYQLKNYYFAKLEGEKEWRQLARVNIAVHRRRVHADRGDPRHQLRLRHARSRGPRRALEVDLADKEDPQLIFASSRVDVRPVYTPDNRVLAVYPDSGSKDAFYVEPGAELLGEVLGRLFKDKMYYIQDMSADMKTVVVMAESDVLAPEFHVLDMSGTAGQTAACRLAFPGAREHRSRKDRIPHLPGARWDAHPGFLTRPVNAAGCRRSSSCRTAGRGRATAGASTAGCRRWRAKVMPCCR